MIDIEDIKCQSIESNITTLFEDYSQERWAKYEGSGSIPSKVVSGIGLSAFNLIDGFFNLLNGVEFAHKRYESTGDYNTYRISCEAMLRVYSNDTPIELLVPSNESDSKEKKQGFIRRIIEAIKRAIKWFRSIFKKSVKIKTNKFQSILLDYKKLLDHVRYHYHDDDITKFIKEKKDFKIKHKTRRTHISKSNMTWDTVDVGSIRKNIRKYLQLANKINTVLKSSSVNTDYLTKEVNDELTFDSTKHEAKLSNDTIELLIDRGLLKELSDIEYGVNNTLRFLESMVDTMGKYIGKSTDIIDPKRLAQYENFKTGVLQVNKIIDILIECSKDVYNVADAAYHHYLDKHN